MPGERPPVSKKRNFVGTPLGERSAAPGQHMKILILGAGQVGRTAADHLSREEANEVTVVDINEDTLRTVQDRFDVRTVAGNAAHPTVLKPREPPRPKSSSRSPRVMR